MFTEDFYLLLYLYSSMYVQQQVWLPVVGILSVGMGRSYVQQRVWLAVVSILRVVMGSAISAFKNLRVTKVI
jgi:hypothetical protein